MYFFSIQKRKRAIFNCLLLIGFVILQAPVFAATKSSSSDSFSPHTETSTEAPKDSVSVEDLNKIAFGSMTQTMLPMSPEQIKRLRTLFNQTQAAAAATPGTPPRPTISSQFVNLAPGATPTVIRRLCHYIGIS